MAASAEVEKQEAPPIDVAHITFRDQRGERPLIALCGVDVSGWDLVNGRGVRSREWETCVVCADIAVGRCS